MSIRNYAFFETMLGKNGPFEAVKGPANGLNNYGPKQPCWGTLMKSNTSAGQKTCDIIKSGELRKPDIFKIGAKSRMATSKSPTCGHPKIPHP